MCFVTTAFVWTPYSAPVDLQQLRLIANMCCGRERLLLLLSYGKRLV